MESGNRDWFWTDKLTAACSLQITAFKKLLQYNGNRDVWKWNYNFCWDQTGALRISRRLSGQRRRDTPARWCERRVIGRWIKSLTFATTSSWVGVQPLAFSASLFLIFSTFLILQFLLQLLSNIFRYSKFFSFNILTFFEYLIPEFFFVLELRKKGVRSLNELQ